MSRLAHAGLSSTASPGRACSNAQRVAASRPVWRLSGTAVEARTASIAAASRPISAAAIEAALAATAVPLHHHAGLEAATRWAFEQARAGDAVLLSPACASLDMFHDYAHRAQVFAAEVRAVAADRGVLA